MLTWTRPGLPFQPFQHHVDNLIASYCFVRWWSENVHVYVRWSDYVYVYVRWSEYVHVRRVEVTCQQSISNYEA